MSTFHTTNWNFITRDYFVVCAYLRQPFAPREFRVCVLAPIWCVDLVSAVKVSKC